VGCKLSLRLSRRTAPPSRHQQAGRTSPRASSELCTYRVTSRARAATIRHITDPARRSELYKQPALRPAVCANPHTPVEILGLTMSGASKCPAESALRAACNPSTPLETRKEELLKGSAAETLVAVSSPKALAVARAYALVDNNPWMLDDSTRWGNEVTRALASRPEPPAQLIDHLRKRPTVLARIPGARNHPAFDGRHIADMTASELVAARNVGAELELLTRPDFTVEHAASVLEQPEVGPEPQVIAGCLRRFGADALLAASCLPHWAETRLAAASWLEPLAGHVEHLASPGWDEAQTAEVLTWHHQARERLPRFFAALNDPHETREALRTVYALVDGWEGNLADLIAVGMVL